LVSAAEISGLAICFKKELSIEPKKNKWVTFEVIAKTQLNRTRRGREGKGREGKGREGKGREGKGRQGKGREGKAREGKGRQGKGREPDGEGKGRQGQGEPIATGPHIMTTVYILLTDLIYDQPVW